mmetsp:Transcript_4909/g.10194  ORF Transcript_4909/g.10194 Transcript_4909/m.10194 type:complete len:92 (-) Transcript_4909:8-283(-)
MMEAETRTFGVGRKEEELFCSAMARVTQEEDIPENCTHGMRTRTTKITQQKRGRKEGSMLLTIHFLKINRNLVLLFRSNKKLITIEKRNKN